jgi:hypothetical protein
VNRRDRARAARVTRTIDGIPGTVEPGYREQPIQELGLPPEMLAQMARFGIDADDVGMRRYRMGDCTIICSSGERIGVNGERRWHLTISTPHRHPTWDEIKTARYRLMPLDKCFAMLLPPPEVYVNVDAQDHVFQLHEVNDPSMPWTSG